MAGSRNGYGFHLAAFVTGGARWRTGRSETFAGERESAPEPSANGQADERPDPPAPATDPPPLSSRHGAIDAYCLELCGADRMRVAAEEVISSPRLSAPVAGVPEQELLRVTRATASGFAPLVLSAGSPARGVKGPHSECEFTLPRLARRDNGELDRFSEAALREHLGRCVVCRAAQARHERAGRAFSAVLGIAPVQPEPEIRHEPPPITEPTPPPLALDVPAPLEPPPAKPEAVVGSAPPTPSETNFAAGVRYDELRQHRSLSVSARRLPLRGWRALIATLVVGAVAVVLIAALWSSGSSAPNPKSLPPAQLSRVSAPRQ